MRYIWDRSKGATRRVMHLCGYDPITGQPTMRALCGADRRFNASINPPFGLGRPICRRCRAVAVSASDESGSR